MSLLLIIVAVATVLGLGQMVAGYCAVRRFCARRRVGSPARPKVSVLKPLHGAEVLLEAALASLMALDYPDYQIVFGVHDVRDEAVAVVERLRRRHPERDIALVIDPTPHGVNGKVGNLINMLPHASHDILVIADSDVHCRPDYLTSLVAALDAPGTGLVTTLYTALPGDRSLAAALGTDWINHTFLPGALLGRTLGRQDCLGATMALRRATLETVGGLAALADHLADDQVLGRLVLGQGLAVGLADTVVATTVPETGLAALFLHELRWARTIRALAPREYALSVLQYPLAWAVLGVAVSGAASWADIALLAALAGRALAAGATDRLLRRTKSVLAPPTPIWLYPLRDLLSAAVFLTSYAGTRVEWRGQFLHASPAAARNG